MQGLSLFCRQEAKHLQRRIFSLTFAVSVMGPIRTQGWNLLRKCSGFSISGHMLANCTSESISVEKNPHIQVRFHVAEHTETRKCFWLPVSGEQTIVYRYHLCIIKV